MLAREATKRLPTGAVGVSSAMDALNAHPPNSCQRDAALVLPCYASLSYVVPLRVRIVYEYLTPMPLSKWRTRDRYGKMREGVCGARRAVRMTAGLHPCRLTSWSFSEEIHSCWLQGGMYTGTTSAPRSREQQCLRTAFRPCCVYQAVARTWLCDCSISTLNLRQLTPWGWLPAARLGGFLWDGRY